MRFRFGETVASLSLTGLLLAVSAASGGAEPARAGFYVAAPEAGGWSQLLRSMGLVESSASEARLIVAGRNAVGAPEEWLAKIDAGMVVVLEGESPLASALGFRAGKGSVRVARIRDARDPGLRIQWEDPLKVPVFTVPKQAHVFATAGRGRVPLMAGLTRGRGSVLWLAAPVGTGGYERFPYLPQALAELGVRSPFESRRLWAFFDAAYRLRSDPDALAAQWRKAGISAVHAGAWNYFEPDEDSDRYLRNLIAACHRHNVLVYAWLELPHVSARFWAAHPEWREKTARLRDAKIDWRLLMNLADPACNQAVVRGVREMLARFDWDGVNLAELYFDGILGIAELAHFTPLNDYVRREFRIAQGFDPYDLFRRGRRTPAGLRAFLDYRADLAARLQEQWIDDLEEMRREKRDLDIVLTHVDDRFDPTMRDAIGADAARLLRVLDSHAITFIIEDPATVWNLGPARYAEIARRYAPLTSHQERLGVDINVVERDGGVYPTRKQTGAELLELIHTASESFAQTMFYFEFSIDALDLPFLSSASAVVTQYERRGEAAVVASPHGVGLRWAGPARVDGAEWPVQDGEVVWLPPGRHVVESAPVARATAAPPLAVLDCNGTLKSARVLAAGIELAYKSSARALVLLSRKPVRLTLDGRDTPLDVIPAAAGTCVVPLPRGEHVAVIQ
jgi:hypothetical protein